MAKDQFEISKDQIQDNGISLETALAKRKEADPKTLTPNEFLIKTYMNPKIDIEIRIKAAQAAKKDNKDLKRDVPPANISVNVNPTSNANSPINFDLDAK